MVITGSYNPVYFQEIANHFFGIGSSSYGPATKEEQNTFLHLMETKELLALDYLNSWLILRGFNKKIVDKNLIYIKKTAILEESLAAREKKKKVKNDS